MKTAENPRVDRFLPIIKKIHKEAADFLSKRLTKAEATFDLDPVEDKDKVTPATKKALVQEHLKRVLKRTDEIFFGDKSAPGAGAWPDGSIPQDLSRYKDNNIYSFMIDTVSVVRSMGLMDEFGVNMDDAGLPHSDPYDFFTKLRVKDFPYTASVMERRKLADIDNYLYTQNVELFGAADHIDDMLQDPGIRHELKNRGIKTTPTMTLADFDKLRRAISEIEREAEKKAVVGGGLKEVPFSEVAIINFNSPLQAKEPPYKGVLPTGKTFLDLGKFKWVDLKEGGMKGGRGWNGLEAPYEAFYVRHCGRDSGETFLSLRVRMGNGWYPIALATLDSLDHKPPYRITQLKTYKNNIYHELPAECVDFQRQGIDDLELEEACWWLDSKGVTPAEMRKAVNALLFDDRINPFESSSDVKIDINDDEVVKKLREYARKEFAQGHILLAISNLFKHINFNSDAAMNRDFRDFLEEMLSSWFKVTVQEVAPFYKGILWAGIGECAGWGGHYQSDNLCVKFRMLINELKSNDLESATKFYYANAPRPHDPYRYSSGDAVRYSDPHGQPYVERIVYSRPIKVQAEFDFKVSKYDSDSFEQAVKNNIEIFANRWRDFKFQDPKTKD